MRKYQHWLIPIFIIGLCVFSYFCVEIFLWNPLTIVSYPLRPKFNVDTTQLEQTSKIKVCIYIYPNCKKGEDKTVEEPDKVKRIKQFFQNYSDGWVERDMDGDALIVPIARMEFYDSNNMVIDSYDIGQNYLYTNYLGFKWRRVEEKEIQRLFEIVGIPEPQAGKEF